MQDHGLLATVLSIRSLYKVYRRVYEPILIVCHCLADSDLHDRHRKNTVTLFCQPIQKLFQRHLHSL